MLNSLTHDERKKPRANMKCEHIWTLDDGSISIWIDFIKEVISYIKLYEGGDGRLKMKTKKMRLRICKIRHLRFHIDLCAAAVKVKLFSSLFPLLLSLPSVYSQRKRAEHIDSFIHLFYSSIAHSILCAIAR